MKTFNIYIKSHCEAPDYEDWCEAETKEEASRIFTGRINTLGSTIDFENNEVYEAQWSPQDLLKDIEQDADEVADDNNAKGDGVH